MYLPLVRAFVVVCLAVGPPSLAAANQTSANPPRDIPAKNLPIGSDSVRTDSSVQRRCVVQISTLRVEDMKLDDTLDLLIETGGVEIGGWQFKLAVAGDIIDIVDILPGELIDSCRWEMFDARQVQSPAFPNGPREVWQITAMAQGVSGKKKPVCYGFDRPTSVARLVVSSAHLTSVPDTTVEVFFYWEYCRDNSLSDRGGASLISERVIDALPVNFITKQENLPTRHGLPASCTSRSARNAPLRQVEFRNGGVEFKFKADSSATDSMSPNE